MNWGRLRFLPKSEDFYAIFEEEARNVMKGVSQLKALVADYREVEEKVKEIGDTEHEGDRITHHAIEKLNQTFVTELDREDIHSLISGLDDILDLVDASARRMLLYNIGEPTEELKKLVEILAKSVEEIPKALAHLRDLRKREEIMEHCIELNSLENEGDQVLRATIAELFEKVKDPIYILKWKEIYETVETAIDRCEDVANILEGIILKYS